MNLDVGHITHLQEKMTEEKERGGYIVTYTGKRFYPFDPRIEDIDINDIMHALSNLCRFGGHCTHFYSVAQHCVLVSLLCSPENALWALLHDSTEAYMIDLPTPLKQHESFKYYRESEKRLMSIICDVFGLDHEEPPEVKQVDKKLMATEARDLTFTEGRGWIKDIEPYEFHIKPWTQEQSRVRFMSRLHELVLMKGRK